jgi:large subunit ribosomal protein L9
MGEVVKVTGGYARNYLIPKGLAVGVTRGSVKEIEEQRKVLEVKAARQREQLEAVADRVRSKPVIIKARCSATGKLFGSITNRQLAQEIAGLTGEEIDRHKIVIDDRIRTVGTHHAIIKLHHDVELDLEFEVEGEGFVAEEPEEPAEPEAAEATESPERADAEEVSLNADVTAEVPDAAAEPAAPPRAEADAAELNADTSAEESPAE